MLIPSRRHRAEDLQHWPTLARADALLARAARLERREILAIDALRKFAKAGSFYCGVSWGKDSVVVAHLLWRAGIDAPVIWFPAEEVENPDCALVRDEFLRRFDVRYIEHPAGRLAWSVDGTSVVHDGAQDDFVRASRAYGARYASGVRADESAARKLRMKHWGENTINTCAAIGWWTIEDVYAYLAKYDLPIHPAYACLWGGRYPRDAVRVSTIGGVLGGERGRREWELAYYPETVRRVDQLAREWRAKAHTAKEE